MLQITESVFNEKPVTSLYCARGILPEDDSFGTEVVGIQSMTVGSGKIDFQPRVWGFSYSKRQLKVLPPYCAEDDDDCEESQKSSFAQKVGVDEFANVGDVYESYSTEFKVVEMNKEENLYEVIASSTFEQDGKEITQILKVTYKLIPPASEEVTKEENRKNK